MSGSRVMMRAGYDPNLKFKKVWLSIYKVWGEWLSDRNYNRNNDSKHNDDLWRHIIRNLPQYDKEQLLDGIEYAKNNEGYNLLYNYTGGNHLIDFEIFLLRRFRGGSLRAGRRDLSNEERLKPENRKCIGAEDFVTLDEITDPKYAIRLLENGRHWCFDIRSLQKWFESGKRINPWTNLTFSQANIDKIKKKIRKIGSGNAELDMLKMMIEQEWFKVRPIVVTEYEITTQTPDGKRVSRRFIANFKFNGKNYVLDEITGTASSPDDKDFMVLHDEINVSRFIYKLIQIDRRRHPDRYKYFD